jgi:hypothetical protein
VVKILLAVDSLHFVPYPLTSVDDEKAKGFAFGHFTRAGAVLDNGKVHEGGVEQDDNLIWINGHIHKKQILKSKSKGKTIYVGAGRGKISLYKKKECIEKNIPEEQAVEKLIELIKANGDYKEK